MKSEIRNQDLFRISNLFRISDFVFRIFIVMSIAFLAFPAPMLQIALAESSGSSTFTESLVTTGVSPLPPSIPANLTATPVSDAQIDLTWDPSVGGGLYTVGGYRLFRDSNFLATTTGTSYADLGLTALTTYSYTVEAFDSHGQLSGQSAPVATTTFPIPPSPTPSPTSNPTGGSSSSGTQLFISGIQVVPNLTQAMVSFETNMPTQSKVYWGLTADVELGSLSGLVYGTSHELQISGLEPGTTYFLRVEATNIQGVTVSTTDVFTTTSPAPVYSLPNPSDFTAEPKTDHIKLSWKNPDDPRFDSVRIVRSETFFPRDQFDGVPVYEGKGQLFNDPDVTVGKTYYYAIFAKGRDGLFSSGALAKARIAPAGEIVISATSTDPFANIPQSANVDPRVKGLILADFDFIQEGKILAQVGDTVAVNGSENLIVRLKYEKVPEILKTIAITLADPKDPSKVFPFLLRVNADKSAYEANLAPLGRSGDYGMSIVILDYQDQGLKRIGGNLQALAFAAIPAIPIAIRQGFDPLGFLFLLILILLLLLLLMLSRRRRQEPDREGFDTASQPVTISPSMDESPYFHIK